MEHNIHLAQFYNFNVEFNDAVYNLPILQIVAIPKYQESTAGQQDNDLNFCIIIYNYCESDCQEMKHQDQDQNNLELYLSYPVRHFQQYRKILHPSQYKPCQYKDMPICLTNLIQIYIQYALLMLQTSHQQKPLSLAIFPGYLNKRRVHFYVLDAKPQKGFANINHDQFTTSLVTFIDTLKPMRPVDGQESQTKEDWSQIFQSFHQYLRQFEKSWMKHNHNSPIQKILRFIQRLNTNQLILKYHNVSQIKNTFVFPKTAKDFTYTQKYYSIYSSKMFADYSLAAILEELLTDLQKTLTINNPQMITDGDIDQSQLKQMKKQPEYVYKFNLDLFGFGRTQSEETKSTIRKKYPNQQLKYELRIRSLTPNLIDFTSSSFCQISKMQFADIDTFWLKLKLYLTSVANSLAVEQVIDFSTIALEYGQDSRPILRHRIKRQQFLGAKFICSIDLHLLIHWAIFPFIEASHRKLKQLWYNQQDLDLTDDRLNFLKLVLQRWIRYLYPIFSANLIGYKKKQFTF